MVATITDKAEQKERQISQETEQILSKRKRDLKAE